jgi:hypothetical protein
MAFASMLVLLLTHLWKMGLLFPAGDDALC